MSRPAGVDEEILIANLRTRRVALSELLARSSDHWGYEDPVYRFYHQSFKLFGLQEVTHTIVEQLRALLPGRELNPWFLAIIAAGTGREFEPADNRRWPESTRPILEAFFHARYFLEMAVRYGELETPPNPLPSGYAALLCFYGLR